MVAPLQVCKLAALDMDHRQHLEKLAVSIAHEIRNPLTTIKGFIQLLKPDLKKIGKERDCIYNFLSSCAYREQIVTIEI
jgi:signal transduction histidine kinase